MAGQNIDLGDIMLSQVICYNPIEQQVAVLNRYWSAQVPTGVGNVTFQDLATFLDGAWANAYINIMGNDANYQGTRVRRVWPPNTDAWRDETSNAGAGTAGTTMLPTQTCGLARLFSDTLGKHGEGRQYIPFPAAANNDPHGVPNAGYKTLVTNIIAVLAQIQTVSGSGSKQFQFWPSLYNHVSNVPTLITAGLPAVSWATQKRRGAYGRANLPPI